MSTPTVPPVVPVVPVAPFGLGPRRSLALLGTTAFLFALGMIAQIWGGINFPENAPIEQIFCAAILLDLVAGFVVATTGAIIASRARLPLKRSSLNTIVGLVLVVLALALWIALSGIGIVLRIPTGERGRYMYDVAGALYGGIPWIVGTMLCAYGYRRGGTRGNAIRGLLGTVLGLLLLAATVTSTVLYGLALTD